MIELLQTQQHLPGTYIYTNTHSINSPSIEYIHSWWGVPMKVTHPAADSQVWTAREPQRASCCTPLCVACETETEVWRAEKIVEKEPSRESVKQAVARKGKRRRKGEGVRAIKRARVGERCSEVSALKQQHSDTECYKCLTCCSKSSFMLLWSLIPEYLLGCINLSFYQSLFLMSCAMSLFTSF